MRMRRLMLEMSQTNLADGLGLTFQQVQKYEKGANRIGASRLQHILKQGARHGPVAVHVGRWQCDRGDRGRPQRYAKPPEKGLNLPLAQPRARSAVVRINEDDAGLFERALYCFDGAWPHRVPALKTLYRRARTCRSAPVPSWFPCLCRGTWPCRH